MIPLSVLDLSPITQGSDAAHSFRNTIDLWSAQRRCIITLSDEDIKVMADVFRSKQRLPIEVVNKKFVEFMRACPS